MTKYLLTGKCMTIVLIAVLSACGCNPKIKPSGSGITLKPDSWYAYVKDQRSDNAADIFNITDSIIRLYGDRPGYLMSRTSYTDFELSLDYKWNTEQKYQRGTTKKNSGVMYNVPANIKDTLWPAGIQFQVKEGNTGDFVLLGNVTLAVRGETKAPGASISVARLSEHDNAVGEWNRVVIRSYKGSCKQYLNGALVNEGTNASSVSGRILLQYEGSPIDFRNIVIKNL